MLSISKPVSWAAAAYTIGCLAITMAPLQAAHVTVPFPYENDFSSSVADFHETTDAQWTRNSATSQYVNTISVASLASSANVRVAELGGAPASATNFEVSTQFRATANVSGSSVGLILLADSAASAGYLVDLSKSGTFRILELGTGGVSDSSLTPWGNFVDERLYGIVVTGEYESGTLTLFATLSELEGPLRSVTREVVDTTPQQGAYFGLRNRTGSGTTPTLSASFDYLNIIPEPASLALLAAGGLMMMPRRRGGR